MAYEYSSEQTQLDFPNPYRIENMLWALRAGILLVCALALIFLARKHLAAQSISSFVVPVILGVGLLVLAAWNLVSIGKQLRVFFGRGQPVGLADELGSGQVGTSSKAADLMFTVRQGTLEFAIPTGALNGVLYSLVKHLITAPFYVQNVLQNRFSNLASYGFLLITMGVAMLFVWDTPLQGWVGAFYLALVVFMAVKPVSGGDEDAKVSFNITQIVLLTLAAILGPVALSFIQRSLPDLSWASFGLQAMLILLALALIEGVFFVAVQKHIDLPPPVSKVDTQGSASFNSDPNLLMQEIDREMQRSWSLRIPNRRYARVLPEIALNQRAGNFKGVLLEETQPLAPSAFKRMDWSVVAAYPRFFWLAVIDVLGVVFTLFGALLLVVFAVQFNPFQDWRPVLGFATLGLSLVAVGGYAFRSAHTLWGRFDFESKLTWIDMEGSFIRSKIDLGNRLQDRVFTERDIINVENMTLRVWVTQLRSVVFGHQSGGSATQRIITGMLGLPAESEYLKNLITQFAAAQSVVVAPSSAEDARRMAAMGAMNQLGAASGAAGAPQSIIADMLLQVAHPQAAASGAMVAPKPQRFCTACGERNPADAAFCESCGAALPAMPSA
jgi:zinc-ribbon domain